MVEQKLKGVATGPFAGLPLPLGFGCAHLYGGRQRSASIRLLETAIDGGVTYFDTARLYGHGEAEGLLGIVASGRRDRLFIASKAGILPTHNPPARKLRDRAVRALRAAPPLRPLLRAPAVPEPIFGAFRPDQVRSSVERSLVELRTDYLDLLLLHECEAADLADPALMDLLEALQSEGRIRGWGIATEMDPTLAIVSTPPKGLSVVQVPHSPLAPTLPRVRAATGAPVVVHSVLGVPFQRMIAALMIDHDLRAVCGAVDIDPDDASGLACILLAATMQDNPHGVVLFSASQPDHIGANLKAMDVPRETVAALASVIAKLGSGAPG